MWERAWQRIERIPWTFDGRLQDPEGLKRALLGECERLVELAWQPKFSLITPLWNTDPRHLQELIASVQAQSYFHWELLFLDDASPKTEHLAVAKAATEDPRIKFAQGISNQGISGARNQLLASASGDFLAILDHDDLLHPQALGAFARAMQETPKANFYFSNEYKISDDSKTLSDFFTKCAYSFATLLHTNYLCHFSVMRRELHQELVKKDGVMFRTTYDGAEDHDVYLRLSQLPEFHALHLPVFAYAWRKAKGSTATLLSEKPNALNRSVRATEELLRIKFPHLSVNVSPPGPENRLNTLRLKALSNKPKIAVAIPYKDAVDLTLSCLDSLEAQEGNIELTVYLIDNRSVEPQTKVRLELWLSSQRKHQYRKVTYDHPFNYAKIHNAVFQSDQNSEYFLFLNNDVLLVETDALMQLLLPLLLDTKVGLSGLKLFYPGAKEIQHAGIRFFCELRQSGYFRVGHRTDPNEFLHDNHAVTSVSFACAMMRASAFRHLGGLEPDNLPNGLGDVAAALSLQELGYDVFYVGTSFGLHYESKTRKFTNEDYEYIYLYQKHGAAIFQSLNRTFGYDQFRKINFISGASQDLLDKPLRYRVADSLNDFLKKRMFFLQRLLKLRLAR